MTTIDSKTSTAPDPEVIRVRDLRKRYGSFQAADGVTFAVDRGEVFGLLGPIRSPEPRDPRTEPLDPIPDRRRIPTRGMPAPIGVGGAVASVRNDARRQPDRPASMPSMNACRIAAPGRGHAVGGQAPADRPGTNRCMLSVGRVRDAGMI